MTTDTIEDAVQPLSRAVTKKLETRHGARPDEQTIRIEDRPEHTTPMPRAELIRLMTQNYSVRRGRD